MEENPSPDKLKKELSYYKRQLDQMAGEAIQNDFVLSSLRHELKQKKEAFAILTYLQKAFTVTTQNEIILGTTVKALNTQLGMDRSIILFPCKNAATWKAQYWYGFPEEQLSLLEKTVTEIPATLLQPGQYCLFNKKAATDDTILQIQKKLFINYFIGVPILIDESPLGLIVTGRQFEKLPFHAPLNNSDVDTIMAIAGLISSVFQNKNMMELRLQMKEQVHENQVIRNMLAELKATQAQLIQKEKMASLGELTAGIAHEIQNPLNFVNNFSEINSELAAELKRELEAGNVDEAIALAEEIIKNEQKIIHHGRKADAIVKSMLEHSRQSSGEKQLTDINALVDEYLRLSFHGFRAKDNSFNAALQTSFDEGIGKIEVIPQDIGRVFLNLFNNAFYAIRQKKHQHKGAFKPRVLITTKKADNYIKIYVKDNGVGISAKILGKIYQPFFTTKPTGQGTGLGLSLSYDIITKMHGGKLDVNTKEGEYAEFVIQLPIINVQQ